VQVSTKFGLEN